MGKEIIVKENFKLAMNDDLAQVMAEELDGLGAIPFDRVKIPSGGTTAFEVPGIEDGSFDIAKEIIGVIIDHHPINAWWEKEYSGQKDTPDCSSLDGNLGIKKETGETQDCFSCPLNQYGTGKKGKGKACKNMNRLYILQEGSPLPLMLTLPPTSLKGFRKFIGKSIVFQGMRTHQVISKITLKKAKNDEGIEYSSAQFSVDGKVDEKTAKAIDNYRVFLMKTTRNIEISVEEYNVQETHIKHEKPAVETSEADTDEFCVDVEETEPEFEDATEK